MGSPDTTTVLPTGWVERTLGQLCDVITDGTHYTPRYVANGVPFYSVESVTNDDFENVKHISVEEHRALVRRCRPQRGDILMTRIGSLADTKLIDWDVEASIYVSLALLRPGRVIDGRYLYAFTKSRRFVKAVEDRSLLWAIPKKINMGDIAHVPVLIPADRAEQRAVADAVLCAERHVRELERLIAKKQAIRRGMMQQLLTGKTRLPGFTEPWVETTVGELARIVSGGTPRSSVPAYWDGGIPWCTPTDITSEPGRFLRRTQRTISQEGLERSAAQLLPAGSLLLCTRATIGEVKIAKSPIATNQGFKSLVPRPRVSGEFLYYKVLSMKDELAAKGTGSTFLEVSKRDVAGLEFHAPEFDEQTAIASVLSNVDDELDVLKRRLAKAKSTKSGMMQELLTGRARLPVQEETS